jgi:uncharacterized membrane protein
MNKKKAAVITPTITLGQKFADWVAQVVRSWLFVTCQIIFIAGWIFWVHFHPGTTMDDRSFDILRLILTIEGSFVGSILLMNQHRQSEKDRRIIYNDYILDHRIYKEVRDIRSTVEDLQKKANDKTSSH